jgi:acetyl-CoA synthetase
MSSLLSRFVSKTDYESYEDFKENFKFVVPENFNFAFDVVDAYAAESPKKIALVWCNDNDEEQILTFGDMKWLSDKAANIFRSFGVKKGDTVMLTLKSHWEFWVCMVGLNKIGAIHSINPYAESQGFVYRIKGDLRCSSA